MVQNTNTSAMELSDFEFDQSLAALLQSEDFGDANTSRLRLDNAFFGFDNSAGESWIYPVNYPKRAYQFTMCKQALFKNTLVVLPTGLGKTFIAAVVMYNIYRWYPKGKVIFMAPTRPLVEQQETACYDIMGIAKEDTVLVTGRQTKKNRHENWRSKRVFYATPQAVLSDILNPEHNFPVKDIKLLVIDEAHKARGKFAYCEVVRIISETNKAFRVLALSATPGRTIADVKDVVQNLLISHIEVRSETSIDVAPYTFKKKIRTEVVRFDETIKRVRKELIEIITPYLRTLSESNLVNSNPESNSKGRLIMLQKDFRHLASIEKPRNYSDICTAFSTCISLYHSLELLERHGVRSFLHSMQDSDRENGYKYFVAQNSKLFRLINSIKEEIGCENVSLDNSAFNKKDENFFFGHPKYFVLEQKLLEHFTASDKAKAMIFCEFRDTVVLIDILLAKHAPLIRVKKLVGQGSSSGVKAVTQKEQIAVMKEFKTGKCNCLIATCVAEEGIDVGDVDLIVCFDSNSNPTRYIQRIGRTGRKQQGNVLMLVSEGKESETFKQVVDKKDKTNQNITKSREIEWALYKQSPRLVPPQFNPKCLEVFCNVAKEPDPPEAEEPPKKEEAKKNNRQKKTTTASTSHNKKKDSEAPAGTKDMRHFFKPVSTQLASSLQPTISSIFGKTTQAQQPEPDVTITQYEPDTVMPYVARDSIEPELEPEPAIAYLGNKPPNKSKALQNNENTEQPDEQWNFLNRIRNQLTSRHSKNIPKVPFGGSSPFTDLTNNQFSQGLKKKFDSWTSLKATMNVNENIDRWKKLAEGPSICDNFSKAPHPNESSGLSQQSLDDLEDQDQDISPFEMTIAGLEPVESRYANIETKVHKGFEEDTERGIETSLMELEKSIQLIKDTEDFSEAPPKEEPVFPKIQPTVAPNANDALAALGLTSLDDLFDTEETDEEDALMQHVAEMEMKKPPEVPDVQPEPEDPKISLEEVVDFDNLFGSDDDDDEELLKAENQLSPVQKSPEKSSLVMVKGPLVTVKEPLVTVKEPLVTTSPIKIDSHSSVEEEQEQVQSSQEQPLTGLPSLRRMKMRSQRVISQFNVLTPPRESLEAVLNDNDIPLMNSTKQFIPGQVSTPNIPEFSVKAASTPTSSKLVQRNSKSPSLLQTDFSSSKFLQKLKKLDSTPVARDTSPKVNNSEKLPSPITPARKRVLFPRSLTSPCLGAVIKSPAVDVSPSFATQVQPKGMMGMRKRRIMSDSEEEENQSPQFKAPKKKIKPSKKNSFLDVEANVSRDDSDEEDEDIEGSQSLNGFIVSHESLNESGDTNNMFAKYVQSTRSPSAGPGRFKMPARLKEFDPQEIYSQAVPEVMSQYEVDGSFVVENEDESSSEELCQLEIAEMILEAERKSKKLKRMQKN